MTNADKYKTAEERAKEFDVFCNRSVCAECELAELNKKFATNCCMSFWLELEAEDEKIESCPFCWSSCTVCDVCTDEHYGDGLYTVDCENEDCMYSSGAKKGINAAIAAHNRVARAVKAAKE